jgi:SSS family transporter
MSALDWAVLVGTLVAIAAYGVWKTRADAAGYLRGARAETWPTIGLGVMATQASAITFLSTPGQAYEDGMRFVQFYFGLPIAMVLLSVAVVPRFFHAGVLTAYEYLERRFDLRTRRLAAFLFLLQRGLSAGITIYAPAIILSKVLGWSLHATNVAIGGFVILYTVAGGNRAVSQTQKHQMIVMMGGMAVAFAYIVNGLPAGLSFGRAVDLAGALGRMNVVDTSFNPDSRYTLWSGLTGGFFLALAYFGTDQSQVQRYLSGRSITESRLGLLFNGLFKIPMQFGILFLGVMLFVFHQFDRPPLFFNQAELARARATSAAPELERLERAHEVAFERKRQAALAFTAALDAGDPTKIAAARASLGTAAEVSAGLRREVKAVIGRGPRAESRDADYIFLSFVTRHLPAGLIGLILAVILCAAMSSASAELSALARTTVVDFYRRSVRPNAPEAHHARADKVFTAAWGVLAVLFATFASMVDNLIQAVNILGSLFYGTILGIFATGFFLPRVRGGAVFVAALISEAVVVTAFFASDLGFLWFNAIGCVLVMTLASAMQARPRARVA